MLRKVILLALLFFCSFYNLMATHLRAGQIKVVQIGPRTVIITIEVWTNTRNTTVLFGGDQDILDFGDGQQVLVPEQSNQNSSPSGIPLPQGVAYASYTIRHEYRSPGSYVISYREPNRNEGVLNMDNSVNTTFYLETQIILDPFYGNNSSPVLAIDPIDRACPGVRFTHNPGAFDPNPGDSVSFSLEVPFSDRRTQVINYRPPNDPRFYVQYDNAQEDGTGTPTFGINPVTGTITWDAPGKVGEYNIAFHVIEWRKVNGVWRRLGYVRRDMQILVEDCRNERPTLEIPPDTCVVAGTVLRVNVVGRDQDGHNVKIEAFSPIFNSQAASGFPASIIPNPGVNDWRPVPATTVFEWPTNCLHVKEQPYAVIFKITDNPPLGPRLVTYETWFVKVVGPPPVWNNYTKNDAQRSVTLNWNPYTCANAETMQVWRKVDGSDFQPDNCQTGMPEGLGYELVGNVPIGTTTFNDNNAGKGLAVGARYCYRLVAVFPANTGGESLVSQDICIDPFQINVPVITNVDILRTSETAGIVRVAWVGPKDHPAFPNFTYRVYRNTGFTGTTNPALVGTTTNLEFTDDQSLNTEDNIYNYTVEAVITATGVSLGNSAAASTVRLETASRLQRIELSWNAIVPWSNNINGLTHRVYRGPEGADEKADLQFLTEVNVATGGFLYVDEAIEERVYCYMVETYGSYGNPELPSPLINKSQIICAEPSDPDPPCKPGPAVLAEGRDCDTFIGLEETCGINQFANKLQWTSSDEECNQDIAYYRVYWSNALNGDYKLLKDRIFGTEYEDLGLNDRGEALRNSFAACYRIAAVDRSGNVSELSDPVCFENCPYFELPNVFSPNGDGCNDLFSAYSDRDQIGETPISTRCPIRPDTKVKCARFVERVVFRVYNRWGKQVYSYTGSSNDDNNFIYIDWDGKNDNGQLLSSGVYYYVAEVTFIAIDPKIRFRTIKGWVHLLRGEDE